MSEELKAAYEKFTPKWFKVIRWREFASRVYLYHPRYLVSFVAPVIFYFGVINVHPYTTALIWYKPTTQEERDRLKQRWFIWDKESSFVGRNWEMDKYQGQEPPLYDVWERRKKYPEYYGNKYDMFAGDAYCDSYKDGYFDMIKILGL